MSEPERPSPFVPVVLAWLIPGLGHWKIGRPWPAAFVAAGVIPLFVFGMWLAGFHNVSHERLPYYFVLHAMTGLPGLVADFATRGVRITEPLPLASTGELYSAVAGLLNLMAVADVWARCRRGDPEAMKEALAGENPLAADRLVRAEASDGEPDAVGQPSGEVSRDV